MLSLPILTTQLYSRRSVDDINNLARLCDKSGLEYIESSWFQVKQENLKEGKVQLNLVKTLYQSQFGYTGVIEEIMRTLEKWTDEVLLFGFLDEELQDFYQHFYGFTGWMHFADLSFKRKMFFLDTRFLVMGCLWDVPIYANVQRHFSRHTYIKGLQDDAMLFKGAIERNQTSLGDPDKQHKTIAQWVEEFNKFDSSSFETKVDEFIENKMEVQRLEDLERDILHKILTLYYGLKGGFIYREIEDTIPAGYESKEKRDGKDIDDNYLDLLFESDQKQIQQWLESSGEAAYWMFSTKKSEHFIKKLVYILFEKIDLNNDDQIPLLLEFFMVLEEFGLEGADDLVFFDEEKGGFVWDEGKLVSLRPSDQDDGAKTEPEDTPPPKELTVG
ncbi:hypothetical protein HN481_01590 [Candidatus Parcubacteria bacterium]|nr:hypothetical protein [Candidatus Parcubacteria bacterium]